MKKLFVYLFTISTLCAFDFDVRVAKNDSFLITSHENMPLIGSISIALGALYEGGNSTLGHTFFQSIDALLINTLAVQSTKTVTARLRPFASSAPNVWFAYGKGSNDSFYSGHVSSMTALLTPFVIAYEKQTPWIYSLYLLSLHQMVGRVYTQAHWQSDVIVGLGMGYIAGYLATQLKTPLLLLPFEDGMYIGLRYSF